MWHIHDGGSQMKSDRFLIKAAELYYRDGLSQQEIAKKLHTSRTSISRALIQARNEGYVQIRIQYPEQSDLALERKLEEKYGLTEALIAVPAYEQSSDQEVAFQAVDYILRVLKKNMVFGMTWGRAMHEFVEQLAKDERLRSLSFQNVKLFHFLEHRERYSQIHGIQQHIPIHLQRKSEIYYTVQVITCLHNVCGRYKRKRVDRKY